MTFWTKGKTIWTDEDQLVFDFYYDFYVHRDRWGRRPHGLTFTFWA